MKKLTQVLGALAVLVGVSGFGFAANTCLPSDNYCYVSGPSQNPTTQARLDSSGNQTLNGGLTATTGGFSGTLTTSGSLAPAGKTAYTRTAESGVTISSAILNTATFIVITTTSPAATIVTTATPTISTTTATDGQFLVIKGTSSVSTYTFQDNGTLSGSLLELGAASRVVSDLKVLTLIYDSTIGKWLEVSYGNN